MRAEQWTSVSRLFIQSGRHDPDIVFARHDYAYDATQRRLAPFAGPPVKDFLSLLDRTETRIEGAGVNLLSYVAPGDATACSSTEASTPRRSTARSWSTG